MKGPIRKHEQLQKCRARAKDVNLVFQHIALHDRAFPLFQFWGHVRFLLDLVTSYAYLFLGRGNPSSKQRQNESTLSKDRFNKTGYLHIFLANQSSEFVTHVLFYTSFLLFLFHFLQQPTEGTTVNGTSDGEGTELGKRKEHVLKTGYSKATNLQFGVDFCINN